MTTITIRKIVVQILQIALFLLIFLSLQLLWGLERDSSVSRFFIDNVTVKTAVNFINFFSPSVSAFADGTHMNARGGGINVNNGCEGVEVMFLLTAAMSIVSAPWRAKVIGMIVGLFYVFVLNQIRLVAMFYLVRVDKHLFFVVHGVVAPIILIALTGLFFAFWVSKYGQPFPLTNNGSYVTAD